MSFHLVWFGRFSLWIRLLMKKATLSHIPIISMRMCRYSFKQKQKTPILSMIRATCVSQLICSYELKPKGDDRCSTNDAFVIVSSFSLFSQLHSSSLRWWCVEERFRFLLTCQACHIFSETAKSRSMSCYCTLYFCRLYNAGWYQCRWVGCGCRNAACSQIATSTATTETNVSCNSMMSQWSVLLMLRNVWMCVIHRQCPMQHWFELNGCAGCSQCWWNRIGLLVVVLLQAKESKASTPTSKCMAMDGWCVVYIGCKS